MDNPQSNFNNLHEPILLLNIDIKYILTKFEDILQNEILKYVEKSKDNKKIILDELNIKKTMIIEEDRITIEKNFEDDIAINYRDGHNKYVKIKDIVSDKTYSKNAILETNMYFKELMTRYSNSGFPMSIPLQIILESLNNMSWLLYVQSKSYSIPKAIINKTDVIEAISYLDSKTMIVDITKKIYEEYKKQKSRVRILT